MDYQTVFQTIIEKAQEIIGDVAVTQANKLDGITVKEQADELIVSAEREITSADIENLIELYEDITGKGAYGLGRHAVKELVDEHGESVIAALDLPPVILPSWLKADEFASAL